jgi:hypothetical protein
MAQYHLRISPGAGAESLDFGLRLLEQVPAYRLRFPIDAHLDPILDALVPGSKPIMSDRRLEVVEIRGGCMWPALREGDLVLMRPQEDSASEIEPGRVAIATGPAGLVAHRVQAVQGQAGQLRVTLGGDLSGDDAPRGASEIVGVAQAVYRPGVGFVDLPEPMDLNPLGAAVLARAARLWSWAVRRLADR